MNNVRVDYYTAAWCGPCRTMKPILNELKDAGWDINLIDADANRDKVVANQIAGIPTFIIYKDGIQVQRFSGARSKQAILLVLEKVSQ